jgi:hypothetical protein
MEIRSRGSSPTVAAQQWPSSTATTVNQAALPPVPPEPTSSNDQRGNTLSTPGASIARPSAAYSPVHNANTALELSLDPRRPPLPNLSVSPFPRPTPRPSNSPPATAVHYHMYFGDAAPEDWYRGRDPPRVEPPPETVHTPSEIQLPSHYAPPGSPTTVINDPDSPSGPRVRLHVKNPNKTLDESLVRKPSPITEDPEPAHSGPRKHAFGPSTAQQHAATDNNPPTTTVNRMRPRRQLSDEHDCSTAGCDLETQIAHAQIDSLEARNMPEQWCIPKKRTAYNDRPTPPHLQEWYGGRRAIVEEPAVVEEPTVVEERPGFWRRLKRRTMGGPSEGKKKRNKLTKKRPKKD